MDRLTTRIDRGDEDFESRTEANLALVEALRTRVDAAKEGGGGKYVDRHRERGKSLPRSGYRKSATLRLRSSSFLH